MLSRDEIDTPTVFTVELSTGVLILVHPIYDKKRCFLPCTYGYATTIRRAQGATYRHGCIWFDHTYPAERGYGYVAASRFKSKKGIYLFGKVRRTDWLPVRESKYAMQQDQLDRSEESASDYDSDDEEAMARAYDRDDYATDSEDSGSDYDYLFDDEAYVAGRQADYAIHKAYWDELRQLHAMPGYQIIGTPIQRD